MLSAEALSCVGDFPYVIEARHAELGDDGLLETLQVRWGCGHDHESGGD